MIKKRMSRLCKPDNGVNPIIIPKIKPPAICAGEAAEFRILRNLAINRSMSISPPYYIFLFLSISSM